MSSCSDCSELFASDVFLFSNNLSVLQIVWMMGMTPRRLSKIGALDRTPCCVQNRFHRADEQKEKASQACMGIRVNIWNRAKVSRLITRSLTGVGPHQLGYNALDLDFIKQGDAGGGLGSYAVLCNLPDKVAKYLLEIHPNDYMGLGLPAIPDGASSGDIHKMLNADQVLLCRLIIVFHYAAYL